MSTKKVGTLKKKRVVNVVHAFGFVAHAIRSAGFVSSLDGFGVGLMSLIQRSRSRTFVFEGHD